MISFVRKNPIFFISNWNVKVCISAVSLHFFSTSSQQSIISPTVLDILVRKYDFPREFASRVASELTRIKNPETADSTLSFLRSVGFSNSQLQKILKYDSQFLCSSLDDTIKPQIKHFEDAGFSSADISKIISTNPRILKSSHHLCRRNPEKGAAVLTYLKLSGFSNAQLQKILKYEHQFLSSSIDDIIRPKIKYFEDEGFSSADISKIISVNPRILKSSLHNSIIPSLSVIKELSGSNAAAAIVVRAHPSFVCWNMKTTVLANVEFFKSCGVSMDRIQLAFRNSPTCFKMRPEVVSRAADKVKEMGINVASKAFIYAVPTNATMSKEAWELKLQGFRDVGFSDSDISTMFMKAPAVFRVSMAKIKKITEALLATGKFPMASIVSYPISLTYSFEKRYEPRFRVLTLLETRKLIECWPTLHMISKISDDEFFKEFIMPYADEVTDVNISVFGCKNHL